MVFEVDISQVAVANRALQDAMGRVEWGRVQMYQALEALEGMWAGEAHDAFLTQYTTDNELMVGVCQEVQQVLDYLEEARETYDACERDVNDRIAQVQI